MAGCTYTILETGQKLNENEFKAYLLNGGLKALGVNMNFKEPPKPPTPPKEEKGEDKSGSERDKAILSSMKKAVPESAQPILENKGLRYAVASKKEAETIARQILKDNGIDEALRVAYDSRLSGDVRSFLFNLSINELALQERKETDEAKKKALAERIAFAMIEYDETARDAGRFNSAVYDFYLSPLGMQFYENARREKAFKERYKKEEKGWKQFFEEFQQDPDFASFINEEVAKVYLKDESNAKKAANTLRGVANKIKTQGFGSVLPNWLKADVDNAQKSGVDIKILRNAVAAAINAIAEVIEIGGNVAKVVSEQVEKIKALGVTANDSEIKSWLYDQIKADKKQAFEDKAQKKIESLEKRIEAYKQKIANQEYEAKEKKEETDEKIIELQQELDQVKKDYKAARENFPAYQKAMAEKYIKKMLKKIEGLNEEQRAEVIRMSFKQLTEKGALEYDEFREIIGNVLGLGKMTAAQADEYRRLVEDINNLKTAKENYAKEQTPEAKRKLDAALSRAISARRELAKRVYNDSDLMQTLRSALQLTAIGIPTIAKNFTWNLGSQGLIRFPSHVVIAVANKLIYLGSRMLNKVAGTPIYDNKIGLSQMPFFRGLKLGSKEGVDSLVFGVSSKDYFDKEVYSTPINPVQAGVDLLNFFKGNKKLRVSEFVDRLIRGGISGYYMEMVSRGLTLFDKPLRYAAEYAKASEIGKNELGLKGTDLEVFITVPEEYAKNYFLQKGDTDEVATDKSRAIVDRITLAGDKSVAQQSNLVSDLANYLGGQVKKLEDKSPTSKAAISAGKLVLSPMTLFIKTPANIAWQVFSLVNPEVSVAQSLLFSYRAYNKFKNGDASYKKDLDSAKDWMGTAVVGMGLSLLTGFLVNLGVIESGDDDEEKKERRAKKEYSKQLTLNISKLNRYYTGDPENPNEPDIKVDLSWFGQLGAYLDLSARSMEFAKENPEATDTDKWLNDLTTSSKVAASSSVLNTASVLSQSLQSYDGFKGVLVNNVNTYANIVQPSSFAQMSRAQLDYDYRVKADGFFEQLNNSFSARSDAYRKLTSQYPPSDIGLWGDDLKREGTNKGAEILRFFGISQKSKNKFAQPIFNDYQRTGDAEFLPSVVNKSITVKGEQKELSVDELRHLEMFVGKERKRFVTPIVDGAATVAGKTYFQMDDEEKKDALQIAYRLGLDSGKKLFFEQYPLLQPDLTDEEKDTKKQESVFKKKAKASIQKAAN